MILRHHHLCQLHQYLRDQVLIMSAVFYSTDSTTLSLVSVSVGFGVISSRAAGTRVYIRHKKCQCYRKLTSRPPPLVLSVYGRKVSTRWNFLKSLILIVVSMVTTAAAANIKCISYSCRLNPRARWRNFYSVFLCCLWSHFRASVQESVVESRGCDLLERMHLKISLRC